MQEENTVVIFETAQSQGGNEILGYKNGEAKFCNKPAFRCGCGKFVCAEHYRTKHNGGRLNPLALVARGIANRQVIEEK